jgi:hypothetical protein
VVRGPAPPKLTVLETTSTPTPERPRASRESRPTSDRTEAKPSAKPSPDVEATPAPEIRRVRKTDDEAIKIPAPKSGDEKPAAEEEVKPTEPSGEDGKDESGGPDTVYRVRVKDAFNSHDDADQLASELKGRGFSATVMPSGKGRFEVQVGAYKDKKRAEEKQKELEKNSYKTRVTDKEIDLDKTEKPEPPKSREKEGDKEARKSEESREKAKEGDQ